MDATGEKRVVLEGDARDTSETVTGERERAPAEGVLGSDLPTQSQEKRCRVGGLHLAFSADEDGVKEHVQWWHPEMKSRMDSQSQLNPTDSVFVDGLGAVMSVWKAEKYNRSFVGN